MRGSPDKYISYVNNPSIFRWFKSVKKEKHLFPRLQFSRWHHFIARCHTMRKSILVASELEILLKCCFWHLFAVKPGTHGEQSDWPDTVYGIKAFRKVSAAHPFPSIWSVEWTWKIINEDQIWKPRSVQTARLSCYCCILPLAKTLLSKFSFSVLLHWCL